MFSSGFPPLPLPPLSFERQRFGRDDDETKDRAFASRWSAFVSLASLARTNEDFENVAGKGQLKMSSQTRRAKLTFVATKSIRYASSRLEARIPFSASIFAPPRVFARGRRCVRRCPRREKSKEERRATTRHGEAISIQFRERKGRCTKRALVLSKTRTFAREDVEQFAKITGDSNPIHVSRAELNNIVHGALLVSMFPAIVGSTFPGAKYLRQTAMFRNECPVGARVTATVRKVKETRGGKIVEFETKVRCAEDEGKVSRGRLRAGENRIERSTGRM